MNTRSFVPLVGLVLSNLCGCEPESAVLADDPSAVEIPPNQAETKAAFDQAAAEHAPSGVEVDLPHAPRVSVSPAEAPEHAAAQGEGEDNFVPASRPRRTLNEVAASHRSFLLKLLEESPARVVVRSGEIKWHYERSDESSTGAFLVGEVNAQEACGAPKKLTVRVPLHSEVPRLQPSEGRSLVFFGEWKNGVLTAEWASPWEAESVAVNRVAVSLTTKDLFAKCR